MDWIDKFNENKPQTSYDLNLIQENLDLRDKILFLEEKCKNLESQLASASKPQFSQKPCQSQIQTYQKNQVEKLKTSDNFLLEDSIETKSKIQPKPELFPPLRVRLQKLSEKN